MVAIYDEQFNVFGGKDLAEIAGLANPVTLRSVPRVAKSAVNLRNVVLVFGQDSDGDTLVPVQMRSLRRIRSLPWQPDFVKEGQV